MTRTFPILLTLCLAFTLGACSGDKESGGNETDSTPADDSGEGEIGITISGTVTNLLTGEPASEGLCVSVADPTAAVGGGELAILASSTVNADGTYSVPGVDNTIYIGLLILVEDCEGSAITVMPTATGVKRAEYYDLDPGATLSDFPIYSIDADSQAGFQAGLSGAGYAGDLGTDGALVGFVLDSSGAGIEGAVVQTPDGFPAYYMGADGSFNTSGTVSATRGLFIVPAAPISTYKVSATGYTFEDTLVGSQAGYGVLIRFVGTAE